MTIRRPRAGRDPTRGGPPPAAAPVVPLEVGADAGDGGDGTTE